MHTKHTTMYTMIKKCKQKNKKECDKQNSHISSKLHIEGRSCKHCCRGTAVSYIFRVCVCMCVCVCILP